MEMVEMMKMWIGWHFLPEDGRMRYDNKLLVKVGKRYAAKGPLLLCENGMHASKNIIDALGYAPGPIVCRVELSGEIIESGDKACARYREVLAMADATTELHLFACWCATNALTRAKVTDERSWNAIRTKKLWLKGKATDADLAAAGAAAWNAAWAASAGGGARASAAAAAWAAARAATDAAAWAAARSARDAARAAVWAAGDAARDAVWDAQSRYLTRRIDQLFEAKSEPQWHGEPPLVGWEKKGKP